MNNNKTFKETLELIDDTLEHLELTESSFETKERVIGIKDAVSNLYSPVLFAIKELSNKCESVININKETKVIVPLTTFSELILWYNKQEFLKLKSDYKNLKEEKDNLENNLEEFKNSLALHKCKIEILNVDIKSNKDKIKLKNRILIGSFIIIIILLIIIKLIIP